MPPTVTPAPPRAASPESSAAAGQGTPARAAAAASLNQPAQAPALGNAPPPPPITFVAGGATKVAAAAATATPVLIPQLAPSRGSVRGWIEGSLLALDVPIRSQFDGSEYQASNCGPTSMAMVLDSFGVDVATSKLRNLANLLQGTYDPETGIALDYLAAIASEAGLRPLGLRAGGPAYRRWSVADVRNEVRRGHPVVTLVKMRELPDHAVSRSETDHYVVVVGLDGDGLLINDPALPGEQGFRRPIAPAQLERAWDSSSIPRQAIAVAAGDGVPELNFKDPLGAAAPPPSAPLEPAMVLPNLPPLPVVPIQPEASSSTPPPPVESAAAPATPIVIFVTPVAPQVVVVQVSAPALATPTPPPPGERWGRPAAVAAAPVAPQDGCRAGSAWARVPGDRTGCEPLVLGSSTAPASGDLPLRSVVIVGELLVSLVVVRWVLR
jgi:uncharacterized protein YvpB